MMERWGWRIPFLLVAPIGAFILSKMSSKVLHGAASSNTADQANWDDNDLDSEACKGQSPTLPPIFLVVLRFLFYYCYI